MASISSAQSKRDAVPWRYPGVEDTDQDAIPDICNLEWQTQGMPDTEFNRKYPPDAWGQEAMPHARVWKIYRDLQNASHQGMLNSWNKTLDVLLIFAGLFSAVLTAFLVESYKALQPDYTQYVATFLYAAAVSHDRTGIVFPAVDTLAPDRFVQTSATQRWTNGLWFSSLVISLSVALLCILIKQWLDAYDFHVSSASSSPKHWAQRHSLYHRGLEKWGVSGLISFLPLLLHLSLFLFFTGLVLFLSPLDGAISYSLLGMVSCIATFYVLALVLPAWHIECPSYTPLLVQVLLAVSRTISCLLYVIRLLRRHLLSSNREALLTLWLGSIKLRARQQLVRETLAISKHEFQIDGYVLSALIDLPIDANRDVVVTAFQAIGAVTSSRTMEVISHTVRRNGLQDKLNNCYDNLSTAETGFAIVSREQLRRAHQVLEFRKAARWSARWALSRTRDLYSSLGIDGLLMHALEVRGPQVRPSDIDVLMRKLHSLPFSGESSCGFPIRSMCLHFLDDVSTLHHQEPPFLSCFLLVFCAGRFATADMHELVRALQSIERVLRTQCSITLSAHNGEDQDYVFAVVNGLWNMLADFGRYHIDNRTAQLVTYQAVECFGRVSSVNRLLEWEQLSGLASFARSPTFGQCVDTADRLSKYISLFWYLWIPIGAEVALDGYWACVASFLKLSCQWDRVPRPTAVSFACDYKLFPIEPSDWEYITRHSNGGSYASQDDAGSPLRARAVAFAQRIRDGSTPGGELDGECRADCPCMVEGARKVASRPTRWNPLVARFRPDRNAFEMSPNV